MVMLIKARDFRANSGKYIRAAYEGDDIVLTSRSGNVKLVPVAPKDKLAHSYPLVTIARKARKEFKEGKTVTLKSYKDIDTYFDSL